MRNGNIGSLNRKGTGTDLMDKLTYTYQTGTNRLTKVAEDPNSENTGADFEGIHDYTYDAIGQMRR